MGLSPRKPEDLDRMADALAESANLLRRVSVQMTRQGPPELALHFSQAETWTDQIEDWCRQAEREYQKQKKQTDNGMNVHEIITSRQRQVDKPGSRKRKKKRAAT